MTLSFCHCEERPLCHCEARTAEAISSAHYERLPRFQLVMTGERHVIIQLSGGIVEMLNIRKEYIVTDDNKKRAVLIDIKTFERIEEILESYGLGKYMEEVENEKALPFSEAKIYYQVLEKS